MEGMPCKKAWRAPATVPEYQLSIEETIELELESIDNLKNHFFIYRSNKFIYENCSFTGLSATQKHFSATSVQFLG